EVADVVLRQLRAERIDVFLNATVDLVRTEEGGKLIRLAQQDSPPHFVEVDQILVATGRVPASDGLGLDIPGVETDNGRIIVDGRMQTTASHIWACGDVVGPPFSTHVADDQARTVASNILGSNAAWNSKAIPTTIFTDPEIAIVGLNEEEARSEFGEDLEVLRLQFQDIDRAVTDGTESGLVKVLLVPGWNRGLLGGEVAGAHVAGERAGEILQQFAFLMRWRLPVGLLAKTIQSYPTYSLGGRQVVGQHWLDPQVRWGMESPRNRIKDWFADKLDRSS
ncbi:MAG: FAD-dependent oxidoreductase, partial [Thermomicrobiales bacterium]